MTPTMARIAGLALVGVVGNCGEADEPFCDVARCVEACIEDVGCVDLRVDGDGVAHVFAEGDALSLCAAAARASTSDTADGAPCPACHGDSEHE